MKRRIPKEDWGTILENPGWMFRGILAKRERKATRVEMKHAEDMGFRLFRTNGRYFFCDPKKHDTFFELADE